MDSGDTEGFEALKIAGHDLKTPLTALKMLAQLFKTAAERGTIASDPERVARHCELLVKQVDKLTFLADELLDVSRALSGRLQFALTFSDLRPFLLARNLAIDGQDGTFFGYWDASRLTQALDVLLSHFAAPDVVVAKNGEALQLRLSGDLQIEWKPGDPDAYLAGVIVRAHGGTLALSGSSIVITLPLARLRGELDDSKGKTENSRS